MNKEYSDSYLMTKNKKTLIEYLRVAEHNHRVCEETIEQQYKNCMELLKKEREETIKEVSRAMYHQCFECNNDEDLQKWDGGNWFRYKLFENVIEQLKEKKNELG